MIFGEGSFTAQMPFPSKKCPIPCLAKGFGNGCIFVRQNALVGGWQEFRIAFPSRAHPGTNPVGNVESRRVFTCHDGRPRRATNLTRRIALGEFHSFICYSIDVRALIKR